MTGSGRYCEFACAPGSRLSTCGSWSANGSCWARPGVHTVGHFRSSELPEDRHANDRLQSTAVIARRPFEGAHSPKQSPTVVQRGSASDAGRTSAVRAAELELPTRTRSTRCRIRRPEAAIGRRVSSKSRLGVPSALSPCPWKAKSGTGRSDGGRWDGSVLSRSPNPCCLP